MFPSPCNRSDCAQCEEHLTDRRGKRFAERSARFGYGVWVFTTPGAWRPLLTPGQLRHFEKRTRAIVVDCYREAFGVQVGGRKAWHPTGGTCPDCGAEEQSGPMGREGACGECGVLAPFSPHVNYLVPRAGVTRAGELRELPGFIPQSFVKTAHTRLQRLLDEMAKRFGLPDAIEQFFYEYREPGDQSGHAAKYFLRGFAAWGAVLQLLGRQSDWGKLSSGAGRVETGRLYQAEVREELDEAHEEQAERELDERRRCPDSACRCELLYVGAVHEGGKIWRNWLIQGPKLLARAPP